MNYSQIVQNQFLAALACTLLLTTVFSCGDEDSTVELGAVEVSDDLPTGAPVGVPLDGGVTIAVTDTNGDPMADTTVLFMVELGGGDVQPGSAVTDSQGRASVEWTLGAVPVLNRLRITVDDLTTNADVIATLEDPLSPELFADVNAYLEAQEVDGSTEDLAFAPDGSLTVGVPGGLVSVASDGEITAFQTSGDDLITPLGIAYDRSDNLWVADSGGPALRRVSPDGQVTTVLDGESDPSLLMPNYVAIDALDRVYVSDSCGGVVIGYDPAADAEFTRLEFDVSTEGGPNGMAIDAAGEWLYVSTENTAMFCGHDLELTAPVSGLFRAQVSESGLSGRETLAQDVALFGDGMAFDTEGNLYVNFIFEEGFAISESTTWVLPEGGSELVQVLSLTDRVMANLAFAPEAYGQGMLYIAVLAVPPFTAPETRGLLRVDLGQGGLPLLP